MLLKNGNSLLDCSRQGGVFHLWQVRGTHVFFPTQFVQVREKYKLRGNSAWIMHFGPNNDQDLYPNLGPHGFFRTLNSFGGTHTPEESVLTHQFKSTTETHKVFPRAFHAHVGAALSDVELTTQFSVIAVSQADPTYIWPGFHPYFRTPRHFAEITIGDDTYTVSGGHVGKRMLAGDPIITNATTNILANIPGIGLVRIKPQGRFLDEGTMVVVWTDSTEYLCIELVQMVPVELALNSMYSVGCTIQANLE